MEDGLRREVKEETGLTITTERICTTGDFIYDGFILRDKRKLRVRFIELGFICKYRGGEVAISDEHAEYKWATKDELRRLKFTPDSKKLIDEYLRKS